MNAEILNLFRTLAPEFDIEKYPDSVIESRIEIYKDFCSKKRFGRFYTRAVALLVAHFLTLEKFVAEDGAASGFITGGGLTGEKEGDLQRTFGAVSSSSSSDNPDALFDKTVYGKMFLLLRKMCIVPATVRIGRDECGRKGY